MAVELEQLALKWQKTEDLARENAEKLEKLEAQQQILQRLTTSVAVLAEQMRGINRNVATLATDLEGMKSRPAHRWEALLAALTSAAVTWALTRLLP